MMNNLISLFKIGALVLIAQASSQSNYIKHDEQKVLRNSHPAVESEYARKLDDLGILKSIQGKEIEEQSLDNCKALVYQALKSLPQEHIKHLRNLTLTFKPDASRGLGGGSTIILRCHNVSDAELVGVLVHEIGHIADSSHLKGDGKSGRTKFYDFDTPVYKNDASYDFYKISWTDDKSRKINADQFDFVSEYAMTDPFEDFAESYNYYLLQGGQFKKLARNNKALQNKYEFFKNKVFDGREFGYGTSSISFIERPYDVTLLSYDLRRFIN